MKSSTGRLAEGSHVLGIETSCDDTCAAVYQVGVGVVRDQVRSQRAAHRDYSGVVPEIASRNHLASLLGLVSSALGSLRPDAVACTTGPGLAGCLACGWALAQSLAYSWRVPVAAVNHLEGHLLSPFLEPEDGFGFPYLALLVSGGHTALVHVERLHRYEVLAETLDDAVGEAFDKTGALLGLGFPGGPQLERLARSGDADRCPLPVPMARRSGLAMSFSGLKSAARRKLASGCDKADIAAAFQRAAVETVAAKTGRALERTGSGRLAVVGGVARNDALRMALERTAGERGARLYCPPPRWCTDNAAMIAYAGARRLQRGYAAQVRPRWPLQTMP